ncbi:DUF6239 family natural product biosynthesis protein [Actinophytocola sediminis]
MEPLLIVAQGHSHQLELGVTMGPLVLRVAVLAAVPVVAGFALLRGFLTEPGRLPTAIVVAVAGGVGALELLLAGGLTLPQQTVPLLLAALGAPLYLALSRDRKAARSVDRARRLAPWVFWPVAALAVTQFWLAMFADASRERTAVGLHTAVLLALVALSWFAVARPRRGVRALRAGAALVAVGLIAGTAQATVLRPAETVPGVATSVSVLVGERSVAAVVVPNLPGWNLVHVDAPDVVVGTGQASTYPRYPATAYPATAGRWLPVELPAGRSQLWLRLGDALGSFTTDTGADQAGAPSALRGPDGPECASALLGAPVAGGRAAAGCPADTLRPEDADELRRTVELVAARHQEVAVVSDQSARAVAAAAVVRAEAARLGVTVSTDQGVPAVVVSGWARAGAALGSGAEVYLAPWLSAPPVLAEADQARPRWVARSFDQDGTSFRWYASSLAADYPGLEPSAAGYRAWLDERRERVAGPVKLYQVGTPAVGR